MTREDAIRHIECVAKNAIEGGYDSAFCSAKALILVAEALKAEPCDTLKLDGMLEDAYEHGYQQARYDCEAQPCEDCVSREAVIELLKDLEREDIERYGCKIPEGFDAEEAVEAVRKLPPVTPKPRTGKWITQHVIGSRNCEMIVCSNCREEFSYDAETGIQINNYDYCPNCGAKMEGESE